MPLRLRHGLALPFQFRLSFLKFGSEALPLNLALRILRRPDVYGLDYTSPLPAGRALHHGCRVALIITMLSFTHSMLASECEVPVVQFSLVGLVGEQDPDYGFPLPLAQGR